MPKAKTKRPKTSTAPKPVPAESQVTRGRTLRPRPAATPKTVDVPVKPRQCTICGRPRLGHPRQCKDGPSAGSRLAALDDAANEREAEILAQEAQFVAGPAAEPLHGEDRMDVDDDAAADPEAPGEALVARSPRSADLPDAPPSNPPVDQTSPLSSNAIAGPAQTAVAHAPASGDLAGALAAIPAAVAGTEKETNTPVSESEPLEGGLRSTPAGDLPLPMKRSTKTKEEYDSRKASKKTTEMFTSMAMTGDLLASRVPGWAFCIFVPMARRGEMRSWTSTKVRGDVPELPAEIRQLIFQRLEPFREQADDERELVLQEKDSLLKEKDSQLEHYKRVAEQAEQRAREKEQEAEALRSAYQSGKELIH